jgi:hypothetical protein
MRKKTKFIDKRDIFTMLKGKYQENQLDTAFQKLENDGIIYCAYDEHYMLSEDSY